MATVSLTLPADGQTIDAADVNTPFNAIATALNGGIDSQNITDSGVTPNELMTGTGSSWAWQSWTPTWTNVVVSNSTVVAKYIQIGKTVHCRLDVTFAGGDKPSGSVKFSLPVTSVSTYSASDLSPIGTAVLGDAGAAAYTGFVRWSSTTTAALYCVLSATPTRSDQVVNATVPFTFGNTDTISCEFTYEAA